MLSPFKRISAKANRNQAWGDDKSQPAALQYLINPVAQNPGLSTILHILSKWCAVTKPLSSMKTEEWEGTLLPFQIENIIIQKQLTSILCLSLSCFSGQLENSITCRCWPKYSKATQMFNADSSPPSPEPKLPTQGEAVFSMYVVLEHKWVMLSPVTEQFLLCLFLSKRHHGWGNLRTPLRITQQGSGKTRFTTQSWVRLLNHTPPKPFSYGMKFKLPMFLGRKGFS